MGRSALLREQSGREPISSAGVVLACSFSRLLRSTVKLPAKVAVMQWVRPNWRLSSWQTCSFPHVREGKAFSSERRAGTRGLVIHLGRQNEANITKLYSPRNVPVHLLDQVGSYTHR
jgi:hypothetical protein